jgi:hypothetical protein
MLMGVESLRYATASPTSLKQGPLNDHFNHEVSPKKRPGSPDDQDLHNDA